MKNWMGKLELELMHTPETTFLGKMKNILSAVILYIAWAGLVLTIYNNFLPGLGQLDSTFTPASKIPIFLQMCIFAPVVEELLYRVLPLELGRLSSNFKVTLLLILISSVIFGNNHILGRFSIPVQGVGGLLFSYVYLKNGRSYVSVIITHFLINFYYFLL